MQMCSRCKERVAVVFISTSNGQDIKNEGLCLVCAKKMGLPQVDNYIKQMGLTDEDIETISEQMTEFADVEGDSFELGGNLSPSFMSNLLGKLGGEDMENIENIADEKTDDKKDKSKKKDKDKNKNAKRKFLDQYCVD